MSTDRIHRAVADDGIEIAARLQGQGPPLVLVHGAFEDGATCWASLLPLLTEAFTCHALDLRGRGLSGSGTDLSPPRNVADVTAYVDSLGEPVSLVGESGGGFVALGAAASTDVVTAVAAHEPVVFEVPNATADFEDVAARVGVLAAEGRLVEAIWAFAKVVGNDDELAALSGQEGAEVVEALAANVAVEVEEFRQLFDFHRSGRAANLSPTSPLQLAKIAVPVLLLHGSRTALGDWATDSIAHIADHVADTHIVELAGSGHFGPGLNPEAIAEELTSFFATVRQPA